MSGDYFSDMAAARKGRRGRRAKLSDYLLESLDPDADAVWKPLGIRRAGNAAGAIRQYFKEGSAKLQTFYALRATTSAERVLQQLASNLGQAQETP